MVTRCGGRRLSLRRRVSNEITLLAEGFQHGASKSDGTDRNPAQEKTLAPKFARRAP